MDIGVMMISDIILIILQTTSECPFLNLVILNYVTASLCNYGNLQFRTNYSPEKLQWYNTAFDFYDSENF